ncbi:MAG: hypothetical protein EOL88_01805 [Bacteroidia bacterium]|nr:hypothetical protein [Bacteroidia bacterium]
MHLSLSQKNKDLFSPAMLTAILLIIINISIGYRVFQFDVLPLADWSAHIYNSRILQQLLFAPGQGMENFYRTEVLHFTNMTDHVMMALLMNFMHGAMASRIVILFMVISLQLSFLYFLSGLKINPLWSLLILPILINSSSIAGMINFNLAVAFMLLLLGLWIRHLSRPRFTQYLILAVLPLLIYCTHIFIFGIAAAATFLLILFFLIFRNTSKEKKKTPSAFLPLSGLFLLSNSIPGLLFFRYLFFSTKIASSLTPDFNIFKTLAALIHLECLKGYDTGIDRTGLHILSITLGMLILLSLLTVFLKFFRRPTPHAANTLRQRMTLVTVRMLTGIWLFLFAALLLLPNQITGAGSYVDMRLEFMLVLFSIMLIAVYMHKSAFRKGYLIFLIPLLIGAEMHRKEIFAFWEKNNDPVITCFYSLSSEWEPFSSVAVIKKNVPWYLKHSDNALGIEKNIICYNNYETLSGHFMTRRNEGSLLDSINYYSRYFDYDQVAWNRIVPGQEPDYLVLLSGSGTIPLPDTVKTAYTQVKKQTAGFYQVEVLKHRP